MDMQMNQMKKEEPRVLTEEQKQAREQFEEGVRQYQPVMENTAYRNMVQTQIRQARTEWQQYLNTQVMDVEKLKQSQVVYGVAPLQRAAIMNQPVPEPTLSEKQQEKRLKQMRKQNQFVTTESVQMQEAVKQSQRQLEQMHWAGEKFQAQVAGAASEQVRNRFLDDRFEQMFHMEIPIEVLAGDGLEQRYGQLQVLDVQMSDFAKLLRQNPNYVQAKSPVEQERIQHYIAMADTFHQVLTALSQLKGLSYGEAGAPESEEVYQQAQMDYATGLKTLMQGNRAEVIRQFDVRYVEERIEQTYQKYEQGYEEKGEHENGYREMREEIRGDYNWMNIEHISDFYQMDGIMDIRSKVEKHPQAYKEHKEIVDAILQDMMQQAEALGLCAAQADIMGEIEVEYAGNIMRKDLAQVANERVGYYEGTYRVMRDRMNAMVEAAKIVMGLHKPEDASALIYLQGKNYLLPEQEQLKEVLDLEAHYYADTMQSRRDAYRRIGEAKGGLAAKDEVLEGTNARKVVLMRTAHRNADGSYTPEDEAWNRKVVHLAELTAISQKTKQPPENLSEADHAWIAQYDAREHYALAKELIEQPIRDVLKFDLSRLYNATPEDLLRMQVELQDLNLPQMAVSDIGALQCPESVQEERRQQLEGYKAQLEAVQKQLAESAKEITELGNQNRTWLEQEGKLRAEYRKADLTEEQKQEVRTNLQSVLQEKEAVSRKIEVLNRRRNVMMQEEEPLKDQLRNPVPTTLKEELIGDRMQEYSAKLEIIRRYADMARGYALQQTLKQGSVAKDLLTKTEQMKRGIYDEADGDKVRDALKVYATEELINKSTRMSEGAWSRLFGNDEVLKIYMRDWLVDAPASQKAQKYNKRFFENENLTERDQKLKTWLSKSHYRLVGEEKPMLKEAVFRSYTSMLNYKCMEAMSDEETDQMLEQLAAGAFLEENATPEEIRRARDTNMAGLRTYVGTLKKHYRYLTQKYGLGMDQIDPLEVFLHYQEIQKDFGNLQVDFEMITKLPEGILDDASEEDVLFKHQIAYYNAMGGIYNMIRATTEAHLLKQADPQQRDGAKLDFTEQMAMYRATMGQLPETVAAREYMKNHTGAPTVVDWKQPYTE